MERLPFLGYPGTVTFYLLNSAVTAVVFAFMLLAVWEFHLTITGRGS